MTNQDREEIKMMIEQAITARFGYVAYATTSANPVYPAGAWFTFNNNPNPGFQGYYAPQDNQPTDKAPGQVQEPAGDNIKEL